MPDNKPTRPAPVGLCGPPSSSMVTPSFATTRRREQYSILATSASSTSSEYRGSSNSSMNQRHEEKSKFQKEVLKLPKEIRNITAGGFAGMVAKSVVAPFDRIKILYQISSAEFHIYNLPKVALNIVRTEGWTALWKGNTATMIRVFPYSGIQFMVFDRCKTYLLRQQEIDYVRRKAKDRNVKRPHWGLSPSESLISGMIAGAVSVCATYPLDLTRAQLAVLRRKADHTNLGFFGVLSSNFQSRVCRVSFPKKKKLHQHGHRLWFVALPYYFLTLHPLLYTCFFNRRVLLVCFVVYHPHLWGYYPIRVSHLHLMNKENVKYVQSFHGMTAIYCDGSCRIGI